MAPGDQRGRSGAGRRGPPQRAVRQGERGAEAQRLAPRLPAQAARTHAAPVQAQEARPVTARMTDVAIEPLIANRREPRLIAPPSAQRRLSVAEAYTVQDRVREALLTRGERLIWLKD